jgi:hypothetical protein
MLPRNNVSRFKYAVLGASLVIAWRASLRKVL